MVENSSCPELVFLPNHAGYDDDEMARLNDFLDCCYEGIAEDWTCQKTAKCGDIYLFWFGKPASVLAGVGVSNGNVQELRNTGWDWTSSKTGWFCDYDPLIGLDKHIKLDEIKKDRLLSDWWHGRPFQGGPKRILRPDVSQRLVDMILANNPKVRTLKQHLSRFASC